ncbi:isochorismatase [Francisella tularensis]|uniref:Isochorismatase family protein n=3 Tax=Francisella tularensis TaxID=263 RepID=A0AAI8BFZ6_FRATH|nr:isochorismatase family protein [Francisella tularensis subsp. holarctica FSC200]AHH46503.1 isochorismatase [Francisella tularensis subsp. holarctica PHIT-FT049]AJI50918.1 isochorismatase family protein [Francisella tularensis subsp. holarctica]AJI58320.1 isochorismatase family protein [Francisella tularensis subsp. holarctica LVS]ALK93635.1 isochorismatase [Francisella tularensis]OPH23021.1 isochorismatase [Francisella tularensis subsp. holarctica FSC022]
MSKLLIMIDIQEGFSSKGVDYIVGKFNKNYSKFEYVCFCTFENKKNSLFERQLKWQDFQNQRDRKLIKKLKTSKNCYFINHHNYTIYNADMKKLINKLTPQQIYLAGIFYDVCVLKAAIDMFDDGVISYIIEDLCTSLHGQDAHKNAFKSLKLALGEDKITSISDIKL